MLRIIRERLRQGYRTAGFPKEEPKLPERFRGLPVVDGQRCGQDCRECKENCPCNAVDPAGTETTLDLGRCLFCADCTACNHGAISFTNDYRLSVSAWRDLLLDRHGLNLASRLENRMLSLFRRSLKLRQVSAGGCNGCEADINVLGTLVFDLGRFGIQFVASPRHADGILITGPVTENMHSALLDTYEAVPDPKIVIAAGACAISGGPFRDSPEVRNGVVGTVPVDLFIPGCPPHPYTTLDGLLRLLDRL